jgi:acetyl-CoA acetyltransferase
MKTVAVLGMGLTKWGKYPDKTIGDLAREAVLAALKDADLSWDKIQYVVAGIDPFTGMTGLTAGATYEAGLGYIGVPATSVWNACASGAYALDVGRNLILSGLYDIVLCVGSSKAPGGFFPTIGAEDDPNNLDAVRFHILGQTNPSNFAFRATRRMHNYGMTETDIAQVKVKNSRQGKLNPYARYSKEYTLEEVLASPMVAYPLRLLEIAATSDGAAAIILGNLKKAKQFIAKPVQLTSVYGPQPKYPNMNYSPVASQSQVSTEATPKGEELVHQCQVTRGALERAGIDAKDLSFAEVYDLSVAMELDWMENIGICKNGEAEKLLREGATTLGGRIPINPSGGVASFGEAVPAQALLQACELVTQLRGAAGPRQVKKAKVGLAVNQGLADSVSCIIMVK